MKTFFLKKNNGSNRSETRYLGPSVENRIVIQAREWQYWNAYPDNSLESSETFLLCFLDQIFLWSWYQIWDHQVSVRIWPQDVQWESYARSHQTLSWNIPSRNDSNDSGVIAYYNHLQNECHMQHWIDFERFEFDGEAVHNHKHYEHHGQRRLGSWWSLK